MAETVLDQKNWRVKTSLNFIYKHNKVNELNDNINVENINENEDIKESIIEKDENLNLNESVISEINFSHKENNNFKEEKKDDKLQRVKELLEEGLSHEEICNKLSIGKGEVLLIKGLLK